MEWTAENQPSTFFAVCARLIGPEVKLTIEQQLPGNLSMLLTGPLVRCLKFVLGALRNCPENACYSDNQTIEGP